MPARLSPAIHDHLTWLGHAQPTGLVVSPHALEALGAILPPNDIPLHRRFLALLSEDQTLPPFPTLARELLGWKTSQPFYLGFEHPLPDDLTISLPEAGETLAPDFAVTHRPLPAPESGDAPTPAERCQLLVVETDHGFDERVTAPGRRHSHSAHARLERLLRATGVQAGLLVNPHGLRLVSAPRGESSGHVDFLAQHMAPVAGRPLLGALVMLLGQPRLLTVPASQRLPALLAHSRKHQNTVSEKLARQVLHALYELTRGIQTAHERSDRTLLTETLKTKPEDIYEGLVTVLLRMVFLLYAEERSLLPDDDAFTNHYTLGALFERLRDDNAAHPDTMDTRFGAWAQLLVQFRLVHDGADEGSMKMPARRGYLFDPERFPFLEGRTTAQKGETRFDPPEVPDGTVLRVLENLLVLDGERLSYRALDVEQIGSVYETLMGFRIETASGPSIAIKAHKAHGAPATINLEALLAVPGPKREKWLKDSADRKLTAAQKPAVRGAEDLDALQEALFPVTDRHATPDRVPAGALVLQPSDARRRSGSHYTPRSLTEPIVRKTLEPILARLAEGRDHGAEPRAILGLKVCDPAMGSGAFLVEACRQLADALVVAWNRHGNTPAEIPSDEDALLFAKREIAQRCLYGVDKNPLAADLAKLSIWLATLARDHPFTFLDHTFRCGDSLVGLNNRQINRFTWEEAKVKTLNLFGQKLTEKIAAARTSRDEIFAVGDYAPTAVKKQKLVYADEQLRLIRLTGDLCVAAFFAGRKPKEREALRREYLERLVACGDLVGNQLDDLLAPLYDEDGEKGVRPFHWEAEYPEVFGRENPGFDAMVGNPPFLGGSRISEMYGGPILQHWLKALISPDALGQVDLCAFFFCRSFSLLRIESSLGLVATNAIAHGSSRIASLAKILADGGRIYQAQTDFPWPGNATLLVCSVVMEKTIKGSHRLTPILNGRDCKFINSRLDARKELGEPASLSANDHLAHIGTSFGSAGFVLDDDEAAKLLELGRNEKIIKRVVGGEEVNAAPSARDGRWVIMFGSRKLEEASEWPELLKIVYERVKPQRMKAKDHGPGAHGKKYWWQHVLRADPLYRAIAGNDTCFVMSRVSTYHALRQETTNRVFNEKVFVFSDPRWSKFAVLQSQIHERWSSEYSSRHGAAINYSVSKCFSTFPLPINLETCDDMASSSRAMHDYREELMTEQSIGLTALYGHFHDPEETNPKILRLRELHTEMDAAVLAAYGWSDVPTACDFFLDYEEPEDDLPSSSGKKKRKKKKPWRYRWPDPVRDDVLARLLELNAERAAQERREGK